MWYVFVDVKDFYSNTGMQRDKCILVDVYMIQRKFVGNYELHKLLHNENIYVEVINSLYGMPQTVRNYQYNRGNI